MLNKLTLKQITDRLFKYILDIDNAVLEFFSYQLYPPELCLNNLSYALNYPSKLYVNAFLRTNTDINSKLNEVPQKYLNEIIQSNKEIKQALNIPSEEIVENEEGESSYNSNFDFLNFTYTKIEIIKLFEIVLNKSNESHKIFKSKDDIRNYATKKTISYLNSLFKTSSINAHSYSFEEMMCIVSNLYFKFLHKHELSLETYPYFNLVTNQGNPLDGDQILNQLQNKLKPKLPFKKYNNLVYTFSELKEKSDYKEKLNSSHNAMYFEISRFINCLDSFDVEENTESADITERIYINTNDLRVKKYLNAILVSYYHLNFLPGYEVFIEKLENLNTLLLNGYTKNFNPNNEIIDFEQIYSALDMCYKQIVVYTDLSYSNQYKEKVDSYSSPIRTSMKNDNKLAQLSVQNLFKRQFLSNNNKNKLYYKEINKSLNTKKRRKVIVKKAPSENDSE